MYIFIYYSIFACILLYVYFGGKILGSFCAGDWESAWQPVCVYWLSLDTPIGNTCAWFLVWVVFHSIPSTLKLLHKHHKPICISSCGNNMGIITHACDLSVKPRSMNTESHQRQSTDSNCVSSSILICQCQDVPSDAISDFILERFHVSLEGLCNCFDVKHIRIQILCLFLIMITWKKSGNERDTSVRQWRGRTISYRPHPRSPLQTHPPLPPPLLLLPPLPHRLPLTQTLPATPVSLRRKSHKSKWNSHPISQLIILPLLSCVTRYSDQTKRHTGRLTTISSPWIHFISFSVLFWLHVCFTYLGPFRPEPPTGPSCGDPGSRSHSGWTGGRRPQTFPRTGRACPDAWLSWRWTSGRAPPGGPRLSFKEIKTKRVIIQPVYICSVFAFQICSAFVLMCNLAIVLLVFLFFLLLLFLLSSRDHFLDGHHCAVLCDDLFDDLSGRLWCRLLFRPLLLCCLPFSSILLPPPAFLLLWLVSLDGQNQNNKLWQTAVQRG